MWTVCSETPGRIWKLGVEQDRILKTRNGERDPKIKKSDAK